MDLKSITLLDDKHLSDWMLFSLSLGSLLKNQAFKNEIRNLYISVPNSIIFTYFLFHGLFHQDATGKINKSRIIKRFLELEQGSIVYYDDCGVWRRCSVVSIEKNYTSTSKYHIQIQLNKKVKLFIPDKDWAIKLIISDQFNSTILNARIMKDFEDFSGVLSALYNPKTIKMLEIMGVPTAYIVGNRVEFDKYLDVMDFKYGSIEFTYRDIIHFNSENHYKNLKWLKSNEEYKDFKPEDFIIFLGSGKTLSSSYKDIDCRRIFIDDQFDNPITSEELKLYIEQEIIIEKKILYTSSILANLSENETTIPNGVNLIAWN